MKKILALVAALSVVMSVVAGGSIAYLSDTDSDKNTMTMGKVEIEQIEQERDENGALVDFTQSKPLYPAVFEGSSIPWADESEWVEAGEQAWKVVADNDSVVDKFVTVKNTGKSEAYVRTIIAYEGDETYGPNGAYIHVVHNTTNVDPDILFEDLGVLKIDGVDYTVFVYTYPEALAAGATSIPSLKQVYMNKAADNDVVEKYGDTYDILVVSQAVQTAGFDDAQTALDTAFGDVATNAAEWFKGVAAEDPSDDPSDDTLNPTIWVADSTELADAIAANHTVIGLEAGTFHMPAAAKGKTLTFVGESKESSIIEVVPAGQGEANGQLDYAFDGSTVTFYDLTIKTNSQLYAGFARLSGTYHDCIIQNTYNLGTGNSEFDYCTFNITNEYLRVGGASTAKFNNCTFNTEGRAILIYQDGTTVAQTVTVKDCTFNATAAAQTWNGIHVAAVSYDGSQGGTYTVNFEGNNTVDSDFNGLWQIKGGEGNVTVNGI